MYVFNNIPFGGVKLRIYTLIILALALVFVSGCINPLVNQGGQTTVSDVIQQATPTDTPSQTAPVTTTAGQSYNDGGISFSYPSNWEIVPKERILTIHDDPNYSDIVAVGPIGDDPTLVSFQRTVSSAQLAAAVNRKKQNIQANNGEVIVQRNFTLDNVPAVALTYEFPDHKYRFLAVFLQRNDMVFAIVLGVERAKFANQKANMELILNSFHVK